MNKKLSSLICFALIVTISIPVISIAFAVKPDKGPLEKIVFIHYKKGHGKPQKEDKGYYKLLVRGAKWESTATIVIDPDGSGLDSDEVKRVIELSAEEWDDGAYSDDWNGVPVNLFDGYEIKDVAPFGTYDGTNAIQWGDYGTPGVIAVCIVWGHFGGPPSQREIVEFDIIFDTFYTWSVSEESGTMDLQNIATHEIGHGAGLGDLYKTRAIEETMYGYSDYGETKKRTLHFGDKAGIQELYGE